MPYSAQNEQSLFRASLGIWPWAVCLLATLTFSPVAHLQGNLVEIADSATWDSYGFVEDDGEDDDPIVPVKYND